MNGLKAVEADTDADTDADADTDTDEQLCSFEQTLPFSVCFFFSVGRRTFDQNRTDASKVKNLPNFDDFRNQFSVSGAFFFGVTPKKGS